MKVPMVPPAAITWAPRCTSSVASSPMRWAPSSFLSAGEKTSLSRPLVSPMICPRGFCFVRGAPHEVRDVLFLAGVLREPHRGDLGDGGGERREADDVTRSVDVGDAGFESSR